MTTELTKIIVKVGNKSQLKFSHSKVFRAITSDELVKIANKHEDCHIVIIENISEDEQKQVKQFALDFMSKGENNAVLFFIPDNDDITSGIADELDYNIYLNIDDLYKTIYDTYNINISASLEDKKKFSAVEIQDSIPEGITDIFGGLGDEEDKDITDVLEQVDNQDKEVAPVTEKVETVVEEVHTTITEEPTVEITENKKEDNTLEVEEQTTTNVNIDKLVETPEKSNKQTSKSSKADKELISKLETQLKDTTDNYNILLKDMKAANTRIISLEDVIKVLKDEKEAMVQRYNSIMKTGDVLEDPISLSEYENLKDSLEKQENKIKELKSTIESQKNTIEEKENTIVEKESYISNINTSTERLKETLDNINKQIESGDIHKEIVEEYTKKLDRLTDENNKLQSEFDRVTDEIQSLNFTITSLSSRVEVESNIKVETLDNLQLALLKITSLNESLTELEKIKKELSDKVSKLEKDLADSNNKVKEHIKTIVELNTKVDTADKRIELANSYAEDEKRKLQSQISDLTTKLSVTEQQLSQKESQYTQLVTTSGLDANGASALAETNKTLENVNKTLREQLGVVTKELNTLKRKDEESQASLNHYKSQCKQLNDTLKEMASVGLGSGTAGSVTASTIPSVNVSLKPINYTGKAQIIPVFGSGSFGITTLAMSLGYKLCATSKVLYLDFDLMTPKADTWFNKIPLCQKVPGISPNDRRMTGLGILYEKGIQTFINYFDAIVNKCEKTKGGGIDYLSGAYYRVDTVKLATADYGMLFNFLASKYQYIVVDMGKLGCSEISDQLIKAISDISDKSAVVTTNDKFDIRNFRVKIQENNIDINKIAWLINMCESTNVDDKIKQIIAPAKYGLILKDTSLYGTRELFTRNRLTKDKLDLFINSVLFAR